MAKNLSNSEVEPDPDFDSLDDIMVWMERCSAALFSKQGTLLSALAEGHLGEYPEFLGMTPDNIRAYFERAVHEVELAAILYMVAYAEARIREDFLYRVSAANKSSGDLLVSAMENLRKKYDKIWQIPLFENGILDQWKVLIQRSHQDGQLFNASQCVNRIGAFKNPLRLRHWIAHGRYWKPKGYSLSQLPPSQVEKIINQGFDTLKKIAIDLKLVPVWKDL